MFDLSAIEDALPDRLRIAWLRTKRHARDAFWWFRHRLDPRHRYHLMNTGLPPGYYDPCTRITWALFEEVDRFVMLTEPIIDWECEPERKQVWADLTTAAAWWRRNRPAPGDEWDRWTDDGRAMHETAERHMTNIVKHLGYLWYP